MIHRRLTGWHSALRGIALGLTLAQGAAAQSGAPPAEQEGDCMASREPHECPDRCPSFDTCYIDEGEGLLYYRVGDQRFDCEALDCKQASTVLADYCCQRGEFAPPSGGGGGGCALQEPGPDRSSESAGWSGLAVLGVVGARRRRWARWLGRPG
jgi:hypothetical protein